MKFASGPVVLMVYVPCGSEMILCPLVPNQIMVALGLARTLHSRFGRSGRVASMVRLSMTGMTGANRDEDTVM